MKLFYVLIIFITLNPSLSAQWLKTDFNDSKALLCIDFIGDNGVLGGWHSPGFIANAYYSSDQGTTWNSASVPDSLRVIVELQIINDSLVYGCGAKNKIINPDNFADLKYDALLTDPKKMKLFKFGILSSLNNEEYRAQFLQSTDSGHSWHYKGSLEDSVTYLTGLHFIDQNTGYVFASTDNSEGILKTTDGGNNWDWSFVPAPGDEIYAFDFLDPLTGYIVGVSSMGGGLIVKTTDGGVTWVPSVLNGVVDVSNVKCIPPSTVVLSGIDVNFNQNIFISTDNGSSWIHSYFFENGLVDGINGLPGGWIIFYGTYYPTGSSTPFVNGTTDFGQTWVETNLSPLTDIIMAGSRMIDNERWYITGKYMLDYGFLLTTLNSGGLPVEIISFTGAQSGNSVRLEWTTASETNNNGFEVQQRTPQNEFKTIGFVKGKGTTSEKQFYSFYDKPEVLSNKIIYRLKQIDLDGSISYSNEVVLDFTAPLEFALLQNYPNPFNPVTRISFNVARIVPVSLRVYNLLGQEVVTLVNELKTPGIYEVNFDAALLPSGVYLYRLEAGSFAATRRMLLLK
jgi:hypothetical protein